MRDLRFSLQLPAHPVSVAAARSVVRVLQPWVEDEQLGLVELIVSELVTNAVRHGSLGTEDRVDVELAVSDQAVSGCVRDRGPAFVVPNLPPR
ncbi:MAG TPA: ATP-binding protein, partial [Acidimicrobiales bacterium]|nr:ATP-binding protein [Acidimicrobiales bacterium]